MQGHGPHMGDAPFSESVVFLQGKVPRYKCLCCYTVCVLACYRICPIHHTSDVTTWIIHFIVHALCLIMEYRNKVFQCSEGFVSNVILFPWQRRTDSSIHAWSTSFNVSSLWDTFWKGAALNTVLSRRVMATTFITAPCKSKEIKHRKHAITMDMLFWHTLL